MTRLALPFRFALLCLTALTFTGCISTGETIRVSGEVVDTEGQRIPGAVVLAEGTKRGGTLTHPGQIEDPNTENESREASVELPGDGSFVATTDWAGALTISVEGYKIRRVDELDTEFLVPNRTFFQSQDQVRLEVVKDE